jgi:hypothetical protein
VNFAADHAGHFRVMFQRPVDPSEPPLPEAGATYATLERLTGAAHAAGYGARLPVDVLVGVCWAVVHGIASLRAEGHAGAGADPTAVVEGLGRLMRPSA